MPANKCRINDRDGQSRTLGNLIVVVNTGRRQMCAKAGGWKFDEEQGIGITSEYSPPRPTQQNTDKLQRGGEINNCAVEKPGRH